MSFVFRVLVFISLSFSLLVIRASAFAQSYQTPKPTIDWQERLTDPQMMSALGHDLMGDQVDYNTGSLSFEQTDVSLPGNSALSVAIKRRISRGLLYDKSEGSEFGDWEIVVPRISAVTAEETNFRTGNRCSDPAQFQTVDVEHKGGPTHPYYSGPRRPFIFGFEYSSGLSIDTLEYGKESLRSLRDGQALYSDAKYVTTGNLKISCLNNITGGGEGFQAISPNGTTYHFDRFYELETEEQRFSNLQEAYVTRYRSIVAATEVTDIHGNWVKYTYNSNNQITRIHSNDGRDISIGYDGANTPISSVTVNGRIWGYEYETYDTDQRYKEWSTAQIMAGQEYYSLDKVTLPDDRFWDFDMEEFSHGTAIQGCTPIDGSISVDLFGHATVGPGVTIKHPSGVTGRFQFSDIKRRVGETALETKSIIGTGTNDFIDVFNTGAWSNSYLQNGASGEISCTPFEALNQDFFPDGLAGQDIQQVLAGISHHLNIAITDIMDIKESGYPETGPSWEPIPNPDYPDPDDGGYMVGSGGGGGAYLDPFVADLRAARDQASQAQSQAQALQLFIQLHLQNEALQAPPDPDWGFSGSIATSVRTVPANILKYHEMRALTRKTLSAPDMPDAIWAMQYQEVPLNHRPTPEDVPNVPADERTNWTKVTDPSGSHAVHYFNWLDQEMGGELKNSEIYDIDENLVESKTFEYSKPTDVVSLPFRSLVYPPASHLNPIYTTRTVTERDGDSYTSEIGYNLDVTSSDYSFGRPVSMRNFSSVNSAPRGTDIEYEHNLSNWILGLPTKVFEVGTTGARREQSSFDYYPNGQLESQTRYGEPWTSYSYDGDGQLDTVTDALQRTTKAENWKRGTPQLIIKAYGTDDEIQMEQIVDDNGWVTSHTDAKGYEATYEHDDMGRLTQIILPGSWDDTHIDYDFPSIGGAIQTITKGQSESKITYDSMFRPTLQQTSALDTGWTSYVNTRYDAMGRVVFASQPSLNPAEMSGVDTAYDGLGRVISTSENVAPFATTLTDYLPNHATRVTDAEGHETTTFKDGYGDVIRIEQPEDTTTTLIRNEWGQITGVRQFGNHNGINMNKLQTYDYDDQQRLCHYNTPSGNSQLFYYNAAGERTHESSGHENVPGCIVPYGPRLISHSYDNLGQLIYTDYIQGGTASIGREYDANGNLEALYQENNNSDETPWYDDDKRVAWVYDYDELNNLTQERLWIDKRIFNQYHFYTPDGSLEKTHRQYHLESWNGVGYTHEVAYTRDGLGRGLSASLLGPGYTGPAGTNGELASGAAYHPSGAMTALNYANGQSFTQTLNARLLPESLTTIGAGGTALDLSYVYNPRGQVSAMTDSVDANNNRTYGYDGQGRLISATGPWGGSAGTSGVNAPASYSYDSLGNMRSKILGSRSVTLSYNAKNRLTAANDSGETGNRTVGYDTRGNVTTLGGQVFSYNGMNRPTGLSGDVEGAHRYDGHGRRVKSVIRTETGRVTRYNVYGAGGELIYVAQHDQSDEDDDYVSSYVKMDGQTIARVKSTANVNGAPTSYTDELTYLHNDHLGSAGSGTKADGTIDWREHYSPFGITLKNDASNDNQAGFTGHIKDSDTGLNYMQARYYDPVIGRFLGQDPVTFMDTGSPGYFNRYSYTMNDPINLIDPYGESPCNTFDCEYIKEKLTDLSAPISRGVDAAYKDPDSFKEGTGKGIHNGFADTVNGVVTLGEIVSPNLSMGQLLDVPNAAPASNLAEQFGMAYGEIGFHTATSVVAAPKAVSGAKVIGNSAKNAATGAGGKYGWLFGRGGKTHGGGFFNRNDYLRIGYGWDNTRKQDVFRIAIGSKKNPNRFKIHLRRFKNPLPPQTK